MCPQSRLPPMSDLSSFPEYDVFPLTPCCYLCLEFLFFSPDEYPPFFDTRIRCLTCNDCWGFIPKGDLFLSLSPHRTSNISITVITHFNNWFICLSHPRLSVPWDIAFVSQSIPVFSLQAHSSCSVHALRWKALRCDLWLFNDFGVSFSALLEVSI